MVRKWFWLLLVLVPSWAWADIGINERYERGEKIIGKVIPTNLPENAMMRGMFRVSGKASTWQPDAKVLEYAIWAEDGQHTVTAVGTWVVTDTGELGGALIDFGYYEYTATFIVGPGGPGPDPPDPQPPPQPVKWQVAIFVESADLDTMPLRQLEITSSLVFRKTLESSGHKLLGVWDKDRPTTTVCDGDVCRQVPVGGKHDAFWAAISGDPLPRVAIAPIGGGPVQDFPLPATAAELLQLLQEARP